MQEILSSLGKSIKAAREGMNLSQEAFAEKCGFDRTYISMIERGKRNISLLNLVKIAAALGLSVSQLTEDIDRGADPN